MKIITLLFFIILIIQFISCTQVYDNGNYKIIINFDRFNSSSKVYYCLQNSTTVEKSFSIKVTIEKSSFTDYVTNTNTVNTANIANTNMKCYNINLLIDLLDYLQKSGYNNNAITITNIITKPSFINCSVLSNNSYLAIQCSNINVCHFTISYSLILACNQYCALSESTIKSPIEAALNNNESLITIVQLLSKPQLFISITETDLLDCAPPLPPSPILPPCKFCTIDMKPSQYIITNNIYQKLSFYHEIHAVLDHMTTCYLLYRNTSLTTGQLIEEILVGTAVHHYPHHFKVNYSIVDSDVSELLLSLPFIGQYRISCCSSSIIDIGMLTIYFGNAISLTGTTNFVNAEINSSSTGVIRLPWICNITQSVDLLPLYRLIPIQNKTCSDVISICKRIKYVSDCIQVFCDSSPCNTDPILTLVCSDVYYYSMRSVITNLVCCCSKLNASQCFIQDSTLCSSSHMSSFPLSFCQSHSIIPPSVLDVLTLENTGSQSHDFASVSSYLISYPCCKCITTTTSSNLFDLCCCLNSTLPLQCSYPYFTTYPCSSDSSFVSISVVSASGYPQWINTLPFNSSFLQQSQQQLSMTKSISVPSNNFHTSLTILYQITSTIDFVSFDLLNVSFTVPLYIDIKSPYSITRFTPQITLNTSDAYLVCPSGTCNTIITNGMTLAYPFAPPENNYAYPSNLYGDCLITDNTNNNNPLMFIHYAFGTVKAVYCYAGGNSACFCGSNCNASSCKFSCGGGRTCYGCLFNKNYTDVTLRCCSTLTNYPLMINHGTCEINRVASIFPTSACYDSGQTSNAYDLTSRILLMVIIITQALVIIDTIDLLSMVLIKKKGEI